MKRRTSLGLIALVALGLGLYVGKRSGERTRGEAHQPTERAPELERETVTLSLPVSASAAPVAREVLPVPDLPPAWFHARVVDGETGAPLPGAAVYVGTEREAEQEPVALADADGRFRFELDPEWGSPLRIALGIEHEGYGWTLVHADTDHEEPTRAKLVTLERAAGLRAVILREGLPVPDLRLNVRELRPSTMRLGRPDDKRWRATTGVDGVAWLKNLPTRVALEVAVFGEGKLLRRLEERVELEPGEQRELEIRIGSGCTIHGVAVTPAGTPVAGLAVWLLAARDSQEAKIYEDEDALHALARRTTDAAGTFVIEDVGVGRWYVGLAPQETPAGPPVPLARLVTVEQDQQRMDVELEVHRELFVHGRVFDPDGKPAEGAHVSAGSCGSQRTSDGEFVVGPVLPGAVRLFAVDQWNGALVHSQVTVQAGDTGVVIAFPASASISGRCVNAEGEPCAARAELVPLEGMLPDARTQLGSKSPGNFAYRSLAPGIYHLVAHDDLGNFGMLEGLVVKSGEELRDLELVLRPGATVNVRLERGQVPSGEPLGPLEVTRVRLLENGVEVGKRAGKKVVSPGELTVAVCAFDLQSNRFRTLESRQVQAVAGTEVEVVFTLEGP